MLSILKKKIKPFCSSEYDKLKLVVLCQPQFMTIKDTINETQKHFKDAGIHIELAMKQHYQLVSTLKSHGIEVILLPPQERYPEQVFTRDIGFTLGQTIFVAEMASNIRQGEEDIFKQWLEDEETSYYNLIGDQIEGGDVIVDRNKIFIGLSDRTNQNAIDHMRSLLPEYEVITIPFTAKYLHLDCVFNVISPHEAIYFPEAFTKKEISTLKNHFDLIEVSNDEQFTLGTNVLSIGQKKIISLPVNKYVNAQLRKRGFEVIEVNITEIIKSGGSFRCCTLPIVRVKSEK